VGAWTPRAHGAREGRVRGFLGGALRCLADSEALPKKKNNSKKLSGIIGRVCATIMILLCFFKTYILFFIDRSTQA
jgi:hypothetical protein